MTLLGSLTYKNRGRSTTTSSKAYNDRPASAASSYTQHEVDELEQWLSRLDRDRALPAKSALTSPRSPTFDLSGRPTYNNLAPGTLLGGSSVGTAAAGLDSNRLYTVAEGTSQLGVQTDPLQRQRSISQPGATRPTPDGQADSTSKAARRSSSIVATGRHQSDTYHPPSPSTARRLKRKSVPLPLDLNTLNASTPITLQEAEEEDSPTDLHAKKETRTYGYDSVGGTLANHSPGNQEIRHPQKMSSPGAAFDPTATIASSHSTSSLQSGRSSVNRRLQPRSPFASPRSDRRRYPQSMERDADIEDDDDDSLFPEESSARIREKLTAAQIIAELDSEPIQTRLRKGSKESFNSIGSSTRSRSERPRDSLESAASSSRSFQLLGRATSTSPKSSLKSHVPPLSQSASGSQSYTSQIPMRKAKLQARDDRSALLRPRPRLISTRSDSSLPLDEDLDLLSSMPDVYSDEPSYPSPTSESRRASLSSLRQFEISGDRTPPIFGSTPARARNSLAVPPPFARSQSHDTRLSASSTSLAAAGGSAQSLCPPSLRDMQQVVLLWIPEEQPSSTTNGKPSQGHVKALSRVILNNVPGKKKSSRRDSTQLISSGLVPADHDISSKDKGKHVATATNLLPLGRWQRCYAILKPSGAFALHDYTDRNVLLSVPLTSLQRTDIRQIDQSLLGRQRCLAIYAKGAAIIGDANGALSSRSQFPTSPSAPEFGSFASMQSSLPDRGKRNPHKPTVLDSESYNTVHLAFQTWVNLHTWLSAMHVHARPEIYPSLLENIVQRPPSLQEDSLSEGEDTTAEQVLSSSRQSRWRRGHHRSSSSSDDQSENHFRVYRNITLQINEARFLSASKERPFSPPTSFAPLPHIPSPTVGFSSMPSLQHEMRRSASIASGSAASIESSEDSMMTGSTEGQLAPSPSVRSVPGSAATVSYPLPVQSTLHKKPVAHDAQRCREEKAKDASDGRLLYCEVWYEGDVLARTSTRKDDNSVFWQEIFQLSNLGKYRHSLFVHVCTIRDGSLSLFGKVEIPLASFKRDVYVEEWFPISIAGAQTASPAGTHAELNLKVRVREDFTFEAKMYRPLENILNGDDYCKILYSLLTEPSIDIDDIVPHLCRIDIGRQRITERLNAMAQYEVAHGGMTASTLFRGNSLLTKTVEYYMRLVGSDWLDASVGDALRRICKNRVGVEIDPTRIEESGHSGLLQDQVRLLEDTTNSVWSAIYNARHHCPNVLRDLFRGVQSIVDKHFGSPDQAPHISTTEKEKMPFTSISAFVFLRFFVPAILNPRLFGLCPAQSPDTKTQRTLTLVAKTLQGLANMASFGGKEPWMAVMNPFLQANLSGFQDFIANICYASTTGRAEWTSPLYEGYTTPISWRRDLRPELLQEGVATLPLFLDVPRELGCLASTVSRLVPDAPQEDDPPEPHRDLVQACLEIHRKIRSRVRTVERSGQMQSSGKVAEGRALVARADTTLRYNASRSRGATISRSTLQKTTAQISRSPQIMESNEATHLLANSSIPSESPSRAKRRSHTVSSVAISQLPSRASTSPYNTGLFPEPDLSAEILDIHLPSHYQERNPPTPQPIDTFGRSSTRTSQIPGSHTTQFAGQNIHTLPSSPGPPVPTPRGNAFPQRSPTTLITPTSPFFNEKTLPASANGLEHEIAERDQAEAMAAKEADKKKTGWARLIR